MTDPAPDLWMDDPTNAWGAAPTWEPLPGAPSHGGDRPGADSDPWLRPPVTATPSPLTSPAGAPRPPASSALTGTTISQPMPQWGQPRHGATDPAEGGTFRARRAGTALRSRRPSAPPRRIGDDQPTRRSVLSVTAGWYGVPAVFYLVWLMTLDGDRQSLAWHGFVTSFPWLFAAVLLSLGVGWFLCTTVVGWRVLTTSFAAAVIGAGLTTVAHSFVL